MVRGSVSGGGAAGEGCGNGRLSGGADWVGLSSDNSLVTVTKELSEGVG